MAFLKAGDTISGQEGRAYATINGQFEEMFYVKAIEATAEKNKAEVRTLGRRGVQHKATGWTGTGTMTIFYVTTRFRQLMLDYIKTGRDTFFDITVTNEDPTSTIGTQTVTLLGVNLDSVVMVSLDTDSENLEEDVEFTFEDVDIGQAFTTPTLG
ncbi:phage portal protein [Paenibacillus sp. FSL R7-0273]|uniref:phage tail tube protein n=1 Tax=Paenibacillus sp. FSL R7-0273 TaxID=1536772 RepID=UPI0004F77532|nr:phage tail tube protein [Paenibacillus sp. FSL R7-0273]AIQ45620.1 phage portal protein [Paenibacillus sp. FSL R7-0273]OMF95139.1 phage portal protein [Paenibacillus sp. FSL R7-0273]